MSSENKASITLGVGDLRSKIDQLSGIQPQEVSLVGQNGCVQGTIQSKARKDNNIDLNNPGRCQSYYFEDECLLVFDLKDYDPPENE
jgi:hypothetical protein